MEIWFWFFAVSLGIRVIGDIIPLRDYYDWELEGPRDIRILLFFVSWLLFVLGMPSLDGGTMTSLLIALVMFFTIASRKTSVIYYALFFLELLVETPLFQ